MNELTCEARFIIDGQMYSMEQIGEQKARKIITEKIDQAMDAAGYEKTYKEKTA